MFPRKKIAVVGGGFGGIACVAGLKESNLEPTCFEQTDKPGGTWCYRKETLDGLGSTMSTTIINHSKEMGAFSNFPPKKESNNFMRHREMYEYILNIATEKDVLRHIQYNSEVVRVQRADDYKDTGNWMVTVKNTLTGSLATDTFDAVLVSVGHINRPKIPSFLGQEDFKGTIIHTHDLKEVKDFKDKVVVVVGMGCSALDAAVESSNVAKQVYISTRSGAHVLQRTGPYGLPYDYILLRRYLLWLLYYFPSNLLGWILEMLYMDLQFHQKLYPVQPDHHVLSKDPVINDNFHDKLLDGAIIQTNDIECFTENGVIFKGDLKETNADVVIMATGYTWKFPFLEDGVVVQEDGRINLYKCMFPAHLEHASLAIVGFLLPFSPIFPLLEMQVRYAAHVFSGKDKLPSKDEMYKDVKDRHDSNSKRFKPSDKMTVRVDYMQYLDELASLIGARPNFLKLFFTDFRLFLKLIFGPCLPYQYRLQGPYTWDGARDTIMKCDERVRFPLSKRNTDQCEQNLLLNFVQKFFKMIIT